MKLPVDYIKTFDALDEALQQSDFEMKDWAEKSGMPASRISELRRLSVEYKNSGKSAGVGRALSEKKLYQLLSGLIDMMGLDMVVEKLRKALQKSTDRQERIQIMIMIANAEDPARLEKALELITAEKRKE